MVDDLALLNAARGGDEAAFRTLVTPFRRELRAHCYRMAGSLDQADDLLQDSLLRAWRGLTAFEGRSTLRTWLYRVTTSACVDALQNKSARMLVTDRGAPADADSAISAPEMDVWIGPCSAALYEDTAPSPEARYGAKESVALAFLAALQLLPARQRAVLLICDVVGWSAQECAGLLEMSVASVNSALQRARETLETRAARWQPKLPEEPTVRTLLARYVAAWESADVPALVALLHQEATLAMPPLPFWLRGRDAIGHSIAGMVLTPEARGVFRLVITEANGMPALAAYQRDGDGYRAFALHVLELTHASHIDSITAFLDPSVFPRLDLPMRI